MTSIKCCLQLAVAWGGLCASAFAAEKSCDVLVVGGGAAGIAAALQSGRFMVPERRACLQDWREQEGTDPCSLVA